jgi:hypothetical protein
MNATPETTATLPHALPLLAQMQPVAPWVRTLRKLALGVFALLAALIETCLAAAPTVDEIVQRTEHAAYFQGRDGRAMVAMTITDEQGRRRERGFTILRRNEGNAAAAQRYFVHLASPADVRNTVFLVWKQAGHDDDRWLYLPALDLSKRIAAGDKRTSFLGSDFFYEDISGRDTREDTHELTKTDATYYVLKNTPKDPAAVEFGHYVMWIHRQSFLPVKVEYYDRAGKPYRVYEALAVKSIAGYPTVVKSRVRDTRRNSATELVFSNVEYDLNLPADIFSERYLRNPPRDYLK